MGKKMKKKPLWLCLSLDKHPPFPFPPNLIKINHLPPSPYFTTESSPIPTVDDSSACSSVQHISAVFFYLRRSTWGSHDCFSSVSSVQPRPPSLCLCPGCDLWSCWEKSLRTYPTLNFKQRRENTSTVIQFNVVLFAFSLSHISLKSLCNNVTHTHTYWFIDYIMTPAVMFQSHVRSVMVQLPYLWPDWNLMKFFNEQSVCDSLWRARLNLHTLLCARKCVCVAVNVLVWACCKNWSYLCISDHGAWLWVHVCLGWVCVSLYGRPVSLKSLLSVTEALRGVWKCQESTTHPQD